MRLVHRRYVREVWIHQLRQWRHEISGMLLLLTGNPNIAVLIAKGRVRSTVLHSANERLPHDGVMNEEYLLFQPPRADVIYVDGVQRRACKLL